MRQSVVLGLKQALRQSLFLSVSSAKYDSVMGTQVQSIYETDLGDFHPTRQGADPFIRGICSLTTVLVHFICLLDTSLSSLNLNKIFMVNLAVSFTHRVFFTCISHTADLERYHSFTMSMYTISQSVLLF